LVAFAGLLAACGPGAAGPTAAVPATPQGPAMTTDGAPATPTATATPTPAPVPTSTQVPPPTATGSPGGPDLSVQKSGQCNWPYTCSFNITVTNVGTAPYSGNLVVTDQPNPPWSTLLAGGGSINAAPTLQFFRVIGSVSGAGSDLAPRPESDLQLQRLFRAGRLQSGLSELCQRAPSTDGNQANNQTCVTFQPPTPTPTPGP